MNVRDVPIPRRMAHLDRDHRGYPIPVMVWRDAEGRPHFTINDDGKRFMLLNDDECSICGQKLLRQRWFVGGPGSAFHPYGIYHDPPLHRDCMHYAMRVCPWLAVPNYSGRIDTKTVRNPKPNQLFMDSTQIPGRPLVFVCVAATSQTAEADGVMGPLAVRPTRPYVAIEFWKEGRQINRDQAAKLLAQLPGMQALVSVPGGHVPK